MPATARIPRFAARIAFTVYAGLSASAAVWAGPQSVLGSQACEAALALSALPERLRDDAAVYTWHDGDYRRDGNESAKFHCFVARNHRDAVIPQCFTQSGVDNIMAGEFYKSRLVMHGTAPEDATNKFEQKVAAGEFEAPEQPGINYMMSAYNWIYQSARQEFIAVPPHVMFFAPDVESDDVGGATFREAVAQKGVPMVVDSGIHAYMVTFTDGSSESEQVEAQCSGHAVLERIASAHRSR